MIYYRGGPEIEDLRPVVVCWVVGPDQDRALIQFGTGSEEIVTVRRFDTVRIDAKNELVFDEEMSAYQWGDVIRRE